MGPARRWPCRQASAATARALALHARRRRRRHLDPASAAADAPESRHPAPAERFRQGWRVDFKFARHTHTTGPTTVLPPCATVLEFGVSPASGTFFGIYAARNASLLDPSSHFATSDIFP